MFRRFVRFVLMLAVGAVARGTTASPDGAFGDKYRARWDAEVESGIAARIERVRKADYTADGFQPGAEVRVEQISSEFQFGANMFLFGQLGSPDRNDAYRAAFTNLFNAATIPFYWREYEPMQGVERFTPRAEDDAEAFWNSFDFAHGNPYAHVSYRRPAPKPLIDFCRAHGVSTHGHALVYLHFIPNWLNDARRPPEETMRLIDAHIRTIAAAAGGTVDQWDVVNESTGRGPTCTPEHPDDLLPHYVKNGGVRFPLPDDHTFRSFAAAAAVFPPSVRLALNDAWPTNQCYPALAKRLVERGAKIDIVGIQKHIFKPGQLLSVARGELDVLPSGTAWDPRTEMRQLALLDASARPIHVSEITLPSPRGLAGLTDDEADAIQARVVRDQYRLWFSWPSVYRITYWNLVDGTGAANERMSSGWFNRDMTPKRVWHVMDELINREWRTRLTVRADANGRIAFRGFKGRYRLTGRGSDGVSVMRELVQP